MAYRQFCRQAPPDFPVFLQDWYLDAVCGPERWRAVMVEKGGTLAAILPFFLKKRLLWRYVSMPVLGRFMGPYVMSQYRNTPTETNLLKELVAQIPPSLVSYSQDFHYNAANWLPFYWQGYQQTTRYSYRLDLSSLEAVWQNIAPDYRNNKIRKARQQVRIEAGGVPDELYRLDSAGYARQGLQTPYSLSFLKNLYEAMQQRGQGEIFLAKDLATGQIHAAACLIWDRSSSYYLIAGEYPALRHSGAGILLAWHCAEYTANTLHLPCFDFLGSMVPAIARVRSQFGALPYPYFRVEKRSYSNFFNPFLFSVPAVFGPRPR
jgi:hypothetical protein